MLQLYSSGKKVLQGRVRVRVTRFLIASADVEGSKLNFHFVVKRSWSVLSELETIVPHME